ncbi:MAG TPA: hypothetical protein VEZ11_05395, partial [Thermoanaerobaculia bacterium]|nr:hypothetical protein [Thermoanaerobaculia bacterium]
MIARGDSRGAIRATAGLREALLSLCAAIWGLAIAIALLPYWMRPAPPGQIPGFLTLAGLDAHAPFRFVASLIILPIALPLLLRAVIRRFARDDTRDWVRIAAGVAMIEPLWFVLLSSNLAWVILAPALVTGVLFALRRFEAKFSRHDVLLVASISPFYFALLDLGYVDGAKAAVTAAGIVLAIRLAIVRLPSRGPEPLPPAYAFLLAPLALISQSEFFTYEQRHVAWLPLLLVCVSPFVLRLIVPATSVARRRSAFLLSVAIYPIVAYAYTSAFSLMAAEKKPRVTFFEDGHSLLPASEMLRGERPYRDILPAHGLISDGLLEFAAMRAHRQVSIGDALKAREVVGGLAGVGVYALATAATAVPEVGFLAYLFATMLGTAVPFVRVMPALFVLAIMLAATRRRAPRLFMWAGLGLIICGLTSLDFCAYTGFAMLVAIARFGKQWRAALRSAAIGLAAGLVPLFAILFAFGIAGSFVTGTFVEVLGLGPVYAGFPWIAPPNLLRLRTFPEALALLLDRDVV